MMLQAALAIGQLGLGAVMGFGSLAAAERLRTKIGRDLATPPLSLGRGEGAGMLSPEAMQMFGLSAQDLQMLEGEAGAIPMLLQLNEMARVQTLRTGSWETAMQTLSDIPVEPWSQDVQLGMIEQSAERIGQAGRGLQERTAQATATRGRARGLYGVTGGPAGGVPMAMATERSAAERGLTATREIQTRANIERRQGNLASLQMQEPIESIDWAAYLGPAMNWDLQKANVEIGVGAIPIQVAGGMGQGMMAGASQQLASIWAPTPEAPSGIPGMIGGIAGGVGAMFGGWGAPGGWGE